MKWCHFSVEQILGILRQPKAGMRAAGLCRQRGIADVTFYLCRSKAGAGDAAGAGRLGQLEEEMAG